LVFVFHLKPDFQARDSIVYCNFYLLEF